MAVKSFRISSLVNVRTALRDRDGFSMAMNGVVVTKPRASAHV
jgi:hypothetical protein